MSNMLKKFTAFFLMISIFTFNHNVVFAKNSEDLSGIDFNMTTIDEENFIIQTIENGIVINEAKTNRVTGKIVLTDFKETFKNESLNITTYNVRDIVIPDNDKEEDVLISALAAYTYFGTLTYRRALSTGNVYNSLSIEAEKIATSLNKQYTINQLSGTSVVVVIAAIVAGFTLGITLMTGELAAKILTIAVGDAYLPTKLSQNINVKVTGDVTTYNVRAKEVGGGNRVSEVKRGVSLLTEVYDNNTGTYLKTTLYDQYYPQFIQKKDNAVATWFYHMFWDDMFSVYSWY